MQQFIVQLTEKPDETLISSDIGCFYADDSFPKEALAETIKAVRAKGKLILLSSGALCQEMRADGVILDFSKSEHIATDYHKEASALKGRVIGGICRNRRHEAMLLSECEPDFIVFRAWTDGADKVRELTAWYQEFFLIQSVLLPVDQDVDFASFQTDFVIITDQMYKKLSLLI